MQEAIKITMTPKIWTEKTDVLSIKLGKKFLKAAG
jgi:hypothetical protein